MAAVSAALLSIPIAHRVALVKKFGPVPTCNGSRIHTVRAVCSVEKKQTTGRNDDLGIEGVFNPLQLPDTHANSHGAALAMASSLVPMLAAAPAALAAGGEYGILEGRTFALIHPVVEGALLFATLYAGYLGWQFRRTREIGTKISELKKSVTAAAAEGAPASPVEIEIEKLTVERKELVKANFRDQHYNVGALLLGAGVTFSVAGCVNTYLRTGRLYPGPHLYAGATITVLWALAAALVPAMQKGNEGARNAHIALNTANVLLFISQVPTGLEIVGKVFEFTTWP